MHHGPHRPERRRQIHAHQARPQHDPPRRRRDPRVRPRQHRRRGRGQGNLGVVFDYSYFIDAWTVDTVERAMAPMYPTWDHATFDAYLERFGLARKRQVKELSRGMQMKLMLAVALSHDAKLLILDEPTSGLDVLARDDLMDLLQDYIADGTRSVLFSTHITSDLERAADFITYITGGRLRYTGPKDEFTESFRIVKGGPDDLAAVAPVAAGVHRYATGFDALVRTGDAARVSGLDVEPASIDDIIRLTNAPGAAAADGERGA
ncbi:ATP-binding cassette domain-containing protein [Bifidobacterium platyrrhinorum]|uniref:ATP-binding cassette domain-containing protein n=1 Tax=Bifidobacterium platyrrhinorum TaxID=2661628 RepID=UPI00384FF832